MSTLFYVVCIVAICVGADTYQKHLKMKREEFKRDPELDESLKKIDMLEERIRVLERIITENKYDLGKEIDKL
ncbi:MAG: hypothetical protein AAFN50_13435 [Pseudomonadota bacterium]